MVYFATFLSGICVGLALAQFTPYGDEMWRAIYANGYSLGAARALTMTIFGVAAGLVCVVIHAILIMVIGIIRHARMTSSNAK